MQGLSGRSYELSACLRSVTLCDFSCGPLSRLSSPPNASGRSTYRTLRFCVFAYKPNLEFAIESLSVSGKCCEGRGMLALAGFHSGDCGLRGADSLRYLGLSKSLISANLQEGIQKCEFGSQLLKPRFYLSAAERFCRELLMRQHFSTPSCACAQCPAPWVESCPSS